LPTQVGNPRFQLVRQNRDMHVGNGNLLHKWNVENDQAYNKLLTSFQPEIANTDMLAT